MNMLFISHSSLDNLEAQGVCDWLREQGWDEIFLDLDPERGIAAGERWEKALHRAASRCDAVLFLVSRHWLDSEWCRREFHLAQKLNGNFSRLREIMENGHVVSDINKSFPYEKLTDSANFVSLLYFFGLLTFKGEHQEGDPDLTIPNETIRTMLNMYAMNLPSPAIKTN